VAERTSGFIYMVSVTGVTGARTDLPPDLADFITRVRAQTDQPLVLGFGISQPEQARMMNGLVDGFIVGRHWSGQAAPASRPCALAAGLRYAL
jgi:tryptophan synthase alpha chain